MIKHTPTDYYNESIYSPTHNRYSEMQIIEQGENRYGYEQNFSISRQVSKRQERNSQRVS